MSENLDLLRIPGAEDFINGTSSSNFPQLEEGFYDQCKVCGYVIDTASFEGHERKLFHLIWQIKHEDTVYTKLGAGWSLPLSCNEKARFRQDILKWFDKSSWTDACDILVKGGILVKADDGSATFDMTKFFNKFGRICVKEKTSQKGTKYAAIDSISPAKKKEDFAFDEIPEFLVSGDKIITYKLADGVGIHKAEKVKAPAESQNGKAPQANVTQVDANAFLNGKPADPDLPF